MRKTVVAYIDRNVAYDQIFIDGQHEIARAISELDDIIFRESLEHRVRITERNLVTIG